VTSLMSVYSESAGQAILTHALTSCSGTVFNLRVERTRSSGLYGWQPTSSTVGSPLTTILMLWQIWPSRY
jgi:hypothetical protein